MTFRAMEIFLSVVKNGSMQAASRELYISPPSVSEAVSELEKEFGVKLFERLNRKLYITPAGEQLHDYAARMMNLNVEMQRQLRSQGENARLRIGATVTVGSSVLLPILRRAELLQAQVSVFNTHSVETRLLQSELDIALVEGVIRHPHLIVEPVIEDELVIACSERHPFAGRADVTLSELAACPLMLREQGSGTREKLMTAFRERSLQPMALWECSSIDALLKAADSGVGVTVISKRLVPPTMAIARLRDFDGRRMFSLVWHKDKFLNAPLLRLMDTCREEGLIAP